MNAHSVRLYRLFVLTMIFPSVGVAALVDRGGGLIYDTEQNVTWLQDANYAKTTGYDADGLMTWGEALSWAANLSYFDSVRGVVYDDWRLPSALNQDGSGPCYGYGCVNSEIGHLYYIDAIRRDGRVYSAGPFKNFTGSSYWSSTPVAGNGIAWLFTFGIGMQNYTGSTGAMLTSFAWAVRDGDVAVPVSNTIRFMDVTNISGINRSGPTFGASWGDFNGDGLPDLWVGNHYAAPSMYLNNGNGTFTDIAASIWPGPMRDAHGAAWADFDNDGDQDLVEVVGGGGAQFNHLWRNDSGIFRDIAGESNLTSPGARSRTPLWLDYDKDGRLDIVLTQAKGGGPQPYILRNSVDGFVDESAKLGVNLDGTSGAYLSDLTGDGKLDLIVQSTVSSKFPAAIYSTGSVPFLAHPGLGYEIGAVSDAIFADFNGDLRSDIFTVRGAIPQQLVIRSPRRLEFRMTATNNEKTVKFNSSASVQLNIFPGVAGVPIYIGQGSQKPETMQMPDAGEGALSVNLDPNNPAYHGVPAYSAGADYGLFIGFDPVAKTWTLSLSSPVSKDVRFIATSAADIQNPQAINFSATPVSPHPNYLIRTSAGFEQRRAQSGLLIGMPCFSAVAGDFDNDMDLDIYLACTYGVSNTGNILLENLGNGTFSLVPMAGGAAGTLIGRSETVVVADYDMDGFLDLFVTNGEGGEPFNNGPHQLFRNLGNGNKWVQIDLNGRFSNPHGIGAVVKVTAGGKTQMREQNGGIHTFSQNYQRLHFGLGSAQIIDSIEIAWPSGITQVLHNVAVNQLLSITETGTTACSDGLDNDGDGYIDFPSDKGCSDWAGMSEQSVEGGIFQQGTGSYGFVSMEAEHYQASVAAPDGHEWLPAGASYPGYSGTDALRALPAVNATVGKGYATLSPRLDYQVNFARTGTLYVWVRMQAPTLSSDSLHVGLNGQEVAGGANIRGPVTGGYVWVGTKANGARASLNVGTAGLHTVNVWMREDGLILDKIILSTDPDYRPSGVGVTESYRR